MDLLYGHRTFMVVEVTSLLFRGAWAIRSRHASPTILSPIQDATPVFLHPWEIRKLITYLLLRWITAILLLWRIALLRRVTLLRWITLLLTVLRHFCCPLVVFFSIFWITMKIGELRESSKIQTSDGKRLVPSYLYRGLTSDPWKTTSGHCVEPRVMEPWSSN